MKNQFLDLLIECLNILEINNKEIITDTIYDILLKNILRVNEITETELRQKCKPYIHHCDLINEENIVEIIASFFSMNYNVTFSTNILNIIDENKKSLLKWYNIIKEDINA
jgi:hypothetical protein